VVSPSQFQPEMAAKAREWLARGCRLVWVVWPDRQAVDEWLPGDQEPHRTLRPGDNLDGGDVMPGFRYPVAKLFNL
jgi:Uma2 family endonuclease